MLSELSVSKMVTANLALWRPLELLRADACDPTVPRDGAVPPRAPPERPRDGESESRAYTRGGLPVGWCSREFSTQELLAYTCPKEPIVVFVEASAAHAAAVSARLAGSVPGAALRLERAVPCSVPAAVPSSWLAVPPTTWRVRCVMTAPPGELRLWFDHDLLHLFRIPYLSLENIIHSSRYECSACGAVFPEPNPLKLHAALRCAAGAGAGRVAELWRRAAGGGGGGLAACPARTERLAAALGAAGGGGRGGHACVYCGRVYSRRYGLRIHVRTHTGWRPLRCSVCRRAFADPSNLNKHNKLHRLRGESARPPASPPATPPATPPCMLNNHKGRV